MQTFPDAVYIPSTTGTNKEISIASMIRTEIESFSSEDAASTNWFPSPLNHIPKFQMGQKL